MEQISNGGLTHETPSPRTQSRIQLPQRLPFSSCTFFHHDRSPPLSMTLAPPNHPNANCAHREQLFRNPLLKGLDHVRLASPILALPHRLHHREGTLPRQYRPQALNRSQIQRRPPQRQFVRLVHPRDQNRHLQFQPAHPTLEPVAGNTQLRIAVLCVFAPFFAPLRESVRGLAPISRIYPDAGFTP